MAFMLAHPGSVPGLDDLETLAANKAPQLIPTLDEEVMKNNGVIANQIKLQAGPYKYSQLIGTFMLHRLPVEERLALAELIPQSYVLGITLATKLLGRNDIAISFEGIKECEGDVQALESFLNLAPCSYLNARPYLTQLVDRYSAGFTTTPQEHVAAKLVGGLALLQVDQQLLAQHGSFLDGLAASSAVNLDEELLALLGDS